MFILVDGIMGSGKTYYAVNFINENIDKYSKIYTNINGFKFDIFENIEVLYFDYAPDGSLSLLEHFNRLKSIYDTPNTNDNHLHKYLLDNNFIMPKQDVSDYKPFLLVIDEAQNYFDKKTDLLIWMQTYHRHLFCDFILITQSASLLYSSYLKQFEYFIHSIPLSRQMFSNKFKYQKHISFPYRDGKYGTSVNTITLPKNTKIFNLYQSGDKVRTKSVLHKYILYFAIFLIVLGVSFYFLINTFFSSNKSKKTTEIEKQNIKNTHTKRELKRVSKRIFKNARYLIIRCLNGYCSVSNGNLAFYFDDLEFLLDRSNSKLIRSKVLSKNYILIHILASESFFDFFKKGVEDDKNSFDVLRSISNGIR